MSYTNGLDKPTDYFNTVLYTGTGSTQSITGVNFQPDLVWTKQRNGTASHGFVDSVRGLDKYLSSEQNIAEYSLSNNGLSSFDSDGFTVVSHAMYNASSSTYASWNWLASNTTASNTQGSITSTVSANTTSGFSIVSYTGTGSNATVGHGLGVAPSFVIIKDRGNALSWVVSGDNIGWNKNMYLDVTQAVQTANHFQDTAPTSSLMYLSTDLAVNGSSRNYIMYCFAEKKGYSKFGSYVGNGATTANSGTFVYLGFKPSLIIVKNTGTEGWQMWDNKRSSFNGQGSNISPNSANAESTGVRVHFFSNGFQLVSSGADQNSSGDTFIYMCFAESPFTTSTGIPTTGR